MQMPEGDPHPSTLPGFRGTRDPECSVTRLRSGRKKKRVEFEDVQPQDIPNPTEDNFPRRCITQLPDANRDSMRVYDTFTAVFKVWKDIATLPAVRDAVVNICGQIMDIRLGNSNNRLIQVPYDDTWSFLSNAGQFLSNIDSSHIKSGNVSIAHLRTYLTVEANREDDISIARAFILFMMGHLWFQTANDTVPLGYLAAVNDLDSAAQYDWGSAIHASLYHGLDTAVTTGGAITGFVQLLPYWFYEYCGVGHLIIKEEAGFVDCGQFVVGEERKTYASYWAEQTSKVGHMLTDSQRMGNLDLFRPSALRAGITPVVVTSASVHSLSQDFSLPGEDLQLRRWRDVRVVPLPPGGGARTRQRGSGPRTRGGSTNRRGRGTGDDFE
ncbi:hypothetical protein GIB67_035268 [Kingdonia uniflora]|uniref:Aminotransferase-like plant mobile domain-containing protein n=1 Tax=Kingdonia uniflora TaxID=39325 RepID=A0A7J7KXY5_9MAGN|nr:hypothetical protein GIB67_035268 [Kingdonia uniflora]